MVGFANIDLSRLPAPNVVQALSFEAILKEMRDDLVVRFPNIANVIDLESEPARKLLEVCAYREVLIRARINDAARATLLAFAVGADLDQLAANFGVARLTIVPASEGVAAIMETDTALRRRVQLGIDAYSVAGPANAYIYFALTALPTLRDASAVQTSPGQVTVTIMKDGADVVPSDADVEVVRNALSADTVRPLTDSVSVVKVAPVLVDVVAELTLYDGPDGAVIAAEAAARVNQLIGELNFIGYDLRRSSLINKLHVDGVLDVALISPAENVIIGTGQCAKINSVTVTIAGRGQ